VTRVGFYIVQSGDAADRLRVAARLTEKAFRRGHRIYLHVADEQQAREVDELLWSFRPSAFLPHGLVGSDDAQQIAIGWQDEPAGHDDLLINLALGIPGFFARFQRVAEVVTQDPGSLAALRQSWRFYQERGYRLEKHEL
jgi:DNA polymerase-3 subunit chi